jgi:Leucine-rich repeat (LRR) protein
MKKYLFYLVFLCFCNPIIAQHIPDAKFAKAIRDHCPTCIDAADNITEDGHNLKNLTISIHEITDLTGLEGFSAITSLNCTNNKLTKLPAVLPSNLTTINVEYNQITSLPTLPNYLRTLNCSDNLLTTLPILPSNLRILDCSHNQISVLPTLPNYLTTLFCSNNLLTTLPTLPPQLEGLICSYNRIKTIPNLPQPLIRLSCDYTDVKCLPFLPNNLTYLDISKTIVCVPNIITTLNINLYEGFISKSINLPICNDLKPPPCDTFPRSVTTKDSVNTTNLSAKITIFPNPTEGSLKIKCLNCTIKNVRIFNAFGQLILETKSPILDFANLGAAMYIVCVESESGLIKVEKIMKM